MRPVLALAAVLWTTSAAAESIVVLGDGEELAAALRGPGRDVRGPSEARSLLQARAGAGAAPVDAFRALAAEGREAYASADFPTAVDRLARAAEAAYASGLPGVPIAELAALELDLAIAQLAAGAIVESDRGLALVLRLDAGVTLDPAHGPPVRRALERARGTVAGLPTFVRTIVTEPAGATIAVDGHELGPSPVQAPDLAEGWHLVTARARGQVPAAARSEVSATSGDTISLPLSASSVPSAALEALDAGDLEEAATLARRVLDVDEVIVVAREDAGLSAFMARRAGLARSGRATSGPQLARLLFFDRFVLPVIPNPPSPPAPPRREARRSSSSVWWVVAGGAVLLAGIVTTAAVWLQVDAPPDQVDLIPRPGAE